MHIIVAMFLSGKKKKKRRDYTSTIYLHFLGGTRYNERKWVIIVRNRLQGWRILLIWTIDPPIVYTRCCFEKKKKTYIPVGAYSIENIFPTYVHLNIFSTQLVMNLPEYLENWTFVATSVTDFRYTSNYFQCFCFETRRFLIRPYKSCKSVVNKRIRIKYTASYAISTKQYA